MNRESNMANCVNAPVKAVQASIPRRSSHRGLRIAKWTEQLPNRDNTVLPFRHLGKSLM